MRHKYVHVIEITKEKGKKVLKKILIEIHVGRVTVGKDSKIVEHG